ncbi:RagB/SusD family nutrient uptake outer membrane protein [Sphingobacterium oryzagri]|uniref:RagB/SusD family nutrient uptake outer membrane protein n=1 Tax=Sphingobacterium oryzagri TaxID=3025669 RepID=A0ABY7WMD0_9SPHI|nr:RagB/SusD family nutrient uptake outer membrane protein [Sphingobacterium sp. KACC 22765]WDF70655.1 RagB/SusD family nutrient uptake outer membrane protein [Sphingobacterium sp. KACC 22765]
MKNNALYITLLCSGLLFASCGKDFLNKNPQGELSEDQVTNSDGVEASLLGAYGILNGNVSGTWGNYSSAPSQWLFGEVAADNAHKGSEETDQPNMNLIELLRPNPANDNLSQMWQVYYEGVLRCNSTINLLRKDQEGPRTISAARATEIEAESKMLRAHYYFFLWRVFQNIPWVDETTTLEEAKVKANNENIYPNIIADLQFAVTNLPEAKIKGEKGRMDRWIAKAYLGKVYLYEKQYGLALPLFKEVIGSKDITTMPFENNFNVETEDGPEALFVSKHAINPNGTGDNANVGDMLGGLYGTSPVGCCGFYQPSIDLVNAYRVTAAGLPYLDGSYRNNPYRSDMGLTGAAKTNYQLDYSLRVDPRLDYTVGRRGVPYLDYGVMPGDAWIRMATYAGPFVGIKTMIYQSQFASFAVPGEAYITALDVNIMRLADVILMAAECSVELGNLNEALGYVNAIRRRAANLPHKQVNGTDVANYVVAPYPSFPDATYARNAVRMERRLELALEGHRFFDLVRWGVAKQVIESYSSFEGGILPAFSGVIFNTHNAYFPIPQIEIDRSGGALTQNTGYN